jgi:ubiquinone/menaquinone biosynthesis C-methylase UbiE
MTDDIKIIKNIYSEGRCYEDMLAYEQRFLKAWEEEASAFFPPNSTILNIGCGKGREAFCLNEKGYKLTGIDISEPVIETAKSITKLNNLNIDFIVSDGLNLAFPNETFDVVIIWAQTFGLFYGEHSQQHILSECKRVLKKNGFLSFSGHDRDFIQANHSEYLIKGYFIPYPDDNPGLRYAVFTVEELVEISVVV